MSSDLNTDTRYEGFSDYKSVSRSIAETINNAVNAYARIQSLHAENAKVSTQMGAEASTHILSASLNLLVEIEDDKESVDEYQEIFNRWTGDDGLIERLKTTRLSLECPEWLDQLIIDIRTAGFELGYLQAGRTSKQEPDDPVERDTEAMFDNL